MTSLKSAESATAVPKLRVPVGVIVAIACTAQFVLVMNTTIVNVALPGIHQAFGLSIDGQQWVINGYLVTFGGFLLFAARAGDLFGQKKVFQAGLVIFTLASLAGGLAQDSGWLLSVAAGVVHGYRTVFVITAAVSLASVILAALLPAKAKPVPAPPAPEPATN
jgi:MFS family permease